VIGKNGAGRRPGRVTGDVVADAVRVIIARIPVVDPFPDVASHVVEPVSVRTVTGLVGRFRRRPVVVGFFLERAVKESDRSGARILAILPWIAGAFPIGEPAIGVGVVAPGKLAIGRILAATRGV